MSPAQEQGHFKEEELHYYQTVGTEADLEHTVGHLMLEGVMTAEQALKALQTTNIPA